MQTNAPAPEVQDEDARNGNYTMSLRKRPGDEAQDADADVPPEASQRDGGLSPASITHKDIVSYLSASCAVSNLIHTSV